MTSSSQGLRARQALPCFPRRSQSRGRERSRLEARFPTGIEELPLAAVAYVAEQVRVDQALRTDYPWAGRTIKYHRSQIRDAFGFRKFTRGDEEKLAAWLAEEVCPVERRDEQLLEALAIRCRSERIEPPGRPDRIIGAARSVFEKTFCERIVRRLGEPGTQRLEVLVEAGSGRGGLLAELKADPGQVSLETLLREVDKLEAVKALQLPPGLFADCSERLVEAWRARATRSYTSDLAAAPQPVRLTLLAALCWTRSAEITDALVDVLLGLVLKISTKADPRVERELTEDLRRVRGKEGILFRLAQAAVEHPDDEVRTALFPVVGEKTLRELAREAKASERAFQARVRTVLRSYTHHYRRMLPPLLAALRFRCDQHRLPAGDGRARPARPVPRRRGQDPLLRRRRAGAHRGRGPEGVARGGSRRHRPGGEDPLRAVRPGGAARRSTPPRELRRWQPVAQPRGRPARRLRRHP